MNPLDGIVAVVLLAGLLENRFPVIPVAAMALVCLRGIACRLGKGSGFEKIEWVIVACLTYWLANYFWSVGDIHNLLSFEFLRRDGALLVTYPVFLFLLGWPLKPGVCRAFWIIFVSALSLIAIPGLVLSLNLPHPLFFEDLRLVGFEGAVGQNMFFGWYEAHNAAGGVYSLAALIALGLIQEQKFSFEGKICVWLLFLCCVAGLAFTFSRGSYLGFVVGAAFILPLRKLTKMLKVGLLVVVPTALMVVMTSSLVERIDTITDPYYGTNAPRLALWGEALDDFALSPLVGIGFGRFNDEFVQFKGIKRFVWVGVKGIVVNADSHAHNSYVHFLAEGGILGFAFTLGIWWFAWGELSFFERKFPKSKLYWLHRSAKACLLAVLMESFTEHVLGRGSLILVLMALVGMTLSSARAELGALRRAKTGDRRFLEERQPWFGVSPRPVGAK